MLEYEITLEKYERCIRMYNYFLEKNEEYLATFWKNAADGFYEKLVALTSVNLVA